MAAVQILTAAADGDIPLVKKLAERLRKSGKGLEQVVEEIKDKRIRRRGPLHLAAWGGKLEMCRFLIKEFLLDIDGVDEEGVTALNFAILGSKSTAVVRLLLDRGADPNKADQNGITPLHNATIQGTYEIAELLLSKGAYVDSVCEKGASLHIAAEDGNVEMMEVLLRHQADPKRTVRLFYTPLTVAIFASSLDCVEQLIKAGADVNAGRPVTPLVVAANDGLTDCIKCLLEAGADANIPDESGRMPVEIAASQGWMECVEILFPHTIPIARFPDWSIDGIIQHAKSGSPKTQDHFPKEYDGSSLKAQGETAFLEKDYANALASYSMAVETNPSNSTLYAKRSLCCLRMGEYDKALDDAYTYRDMEPDLSNSCSEQAAALILLKVNSEFKCEDDIIIRYDDNAAVIIDQKGNPKGTRVFGAIAEELRELNFTKIVSLAPESLMGKDTIADLLTSIRNVDMNKKGTVRIEKLD
uniref:Uncharacterized protein n=2 Tax=BOP clade TaxID=359160 RepID=A0A0D9XBX0_9ORYZ